MSMHFHASTQRTPDATLRKLAVAVALTSLLARPSLAAKPEAQRSADAVYQKERAACLDGSNPQDRATCLKEAGAALAESRRQTLDSGETKVQRRSNAQARCGAVAAADKADCERLARGEGQRSGSVAEGAVVNEITTRTVEPAPAPLPSPAASR